MSKFRTTVGNKLDIHRASRNCNKLGNYTGEKMVEHYLQVHVSFRYIAYFCSMFVNEYTIEASIKMVTEKRRK